MYPHAALPRTNLWRLAAIEDITGAPHARLTGNSPEVSHTTIGWIEDEPDREQRRLLINLTCI